MRNRFSMLVGLALVVGGATVSARVERGSVAQIRKLIYSGEWGCRYTHKSVLAVNSLRTVGSVPRVCLTRLKCDKVGGGEGAWTFNLVCEANGRATCPELIDCIRDEALDSADWEAGRETTKEPQRKGRDRHGRNCRYGWDHPMVVYRNDSKTGGLDAVCATPIVCDSGPKHHVVACPATGSIVKEEDGLEYDVCPKVNDCIDNALPLEKAFTPSELRNLQARNRGIPTSKRVKVNHK